MEISMNNMLYILSFLFFVSCSNDDDNGNETVQCPDPIGNLRADIDDTFTFESRFTTFQNLSQDMILIKSESASLDCILTGSLSIYLEKQIGEQELVLFEPGDTQGPGETIFFDFDDDVILGRFELLEEEGNNVMEITSLNENNIDGTFSATYVLDAGPTRFTQLPDTLRFVNISFRAELFN